MPAAKIKTHTIVILWEHEIITAAKALHKLKEKNVTSDDFTNALKACFAAIYHPDLLKNSSVTIMSANQPLDLTANRRGKSA